MYSLGGEVLPEKLGGVSGPLPKTLTLSVIFSTLFMTWLNIRYPLTIAAGTSCPKYNFMKLAFVDCFIDNGEKVASSKKHT